jgi:hypothetical protein
LAERYETEWAALRKVEQRFGELDLGGGTELRPAKMQEASELIVRARREYAGGLQPDAYSSLTAAESLLESVERDVLRRGRVATSALRQRR